MPNTEPWIWPECLEPKEVEEPLKDVQSLQVLRSCSLKEQWADPLGIQCLWAWGFPPSGPSHSCFPPFNQFLLYRWRNWGMIGFFNLSKVTQLVKGGARMQIQVCEIQLLLIINFAKIKHAWGKRPTRGAGKWQVSPYPSLFIPFLKVCGVLARIIGAGTSEDAPASLWCRDFRQISREVTKTQRPPWCHA